MPAASFDAPEYRPRMHPTPDDRAGAPVPAPAVHPPPLRARTGSPATGPSAPAAGDGGCRSWPEPPFMSPPNKVPIARPVVKPDDPNPILHGCPHSLLRGRYRRRRIAAPPRFRRVALRAADPHTAHCSSPIAATAPRNRDSRRTRATRTGILDLGYSCPYPYLGKSLNLMFSIEEFNVSTKTLKTPRRTMSFPTSTRACSHK